MKKSNVKRFDMGGYTTGMEAMGRLAAEKARRDEQIALDKADALEEFHPEKYIIPGVGARSALRKAVPALVRGGMDILKNEFMGPQTSEGLPTSQRLKDVRAQVAPGRLVRNKADMERIAGYRDQFKPGTSQTRNVKTQGEAEEMGIPYKDYLKGKSKAERASMGLEPEQTSTHWGDHFKKGGAIPKGGKVGKVMGEFKSGSLKSSSGQKVTNRKQAVAIAMSEAGKSKMKKYVEGGKIKWTNDGPDDDQGSIGVSPKGYSAQPPSQPPVIKKPKKKWDNDGPDDDQGSIGISPKKYAKGGDVKKFKEPNRKVPAMKRSSAGESPAMVKKEVKFMEKKGAPKSMIEHEKEEAKGMKKGGMACMKRGGGIERKGYDTVKKFAKGGSIDGCAVRGKTKGKVR